MSRDHKLELASVAVLLAGLVPWFFPSDVAREIVMERDVLLGRYSLGWFAVLAFGITPTCLVLAWALRARRTRSRAAVAARLLLAGLAIALGLGIVDIGARLLQGNVYVKEPIEGATLQPGDDPEAADILRRKPNERYTLRYVDDPLPARSYPGRPAGYPPVDLVLSTDARGFRNPEALTQADVITLGDSFTEGFFVSDDEAWPARLAATTGKTVYNLGVAGGDPEMYARTLRAVGASLKPKTVLVMLYEANDFNGPGAFGTGGARGAPTGLAGYVQTSPLLHAVRRAVVGWLGPVRSDAAVPGFDSVSDWMPVRIPDARHALLPRAGGPSGPERNYALKPKRIRPLAEPAETFAASHGWTATVPLLVDMQAACESAGAELVFVWAPAKARVVMDGARVSAEQLHAFLAFRRRKLPPADELLAGLRRNLTAREDTVRAFCDSHGIRFVSPTLALQARMYLGDQAYYTYDEHWTPLGQEIVAHVVADALR